MKFFTFILITLLPNLILNGQNYVNEGKEFWGLSPYNFANNNSNINVLVYAKRNCTVTFENKAYGYKKIMYAKGGKVNKDTIEERYYFVSMDDEEKISKTGIHVTSTDTISLVFFNFALYRVEPTGIEPLHNPI